LSGLLRFVIARASSAQPGPVKRISAMADSPAGDESATIVSAAGIGQAKFTESAIASSEYVARQLPRATIGQEARLARISSGATIDR
jgi:hypothetical protein